MDACLQTCLVSLVGVQCVGGVVCLLDWNQEIAGVSEHLKIKIYNKTL